MLMADAEDLFVLYELVENTYLVQVSYRIVRTYVEVAFPEFRFFISRISFL
jgi:hypothetical protein